MDIIGMLRKQGQINPINDKVFKYYTIYVRHLLQSNVDWGQTDNLLRALLNCYSDNPYLIEDLSKIKICFNCFKLYGEVTIGRGELVKQECLCTTGTEKKWEGYKFNSKYDICHCCGLEVIPSGSIWSLLHCRDCKDRIMELNKKVGQCVIPIGRHSIMNGIALNGQMPISAIGQFVNAVNTMSNRLDLITQYRKRILAKQAGIFVSSKDAPIIDLILRTNNLELRQRKTEAFFELLASCTNMSVDKAKSSYEELMN